MAAKRARLDLALKELSNRPDTARVAPVLEPEVQESPAARPSREGRVGKRQICGFFDTAVHKQFKKLAVDSEAGTVQELLREALNDLFTKHSLPPIA